MNFCGFGSFTVKLPTGSAKFWCWPEIFDETVNWFCAVFYAGIQILDVKLDSQPRVWRIEQPVYCFGHFSFDPFCFGGAIDDWIFHFHSRLWFKAPPSDFWSSFTGILRHELLSMFLLWREERAQEDREQQEGAFAYDPPKWCCVWTWR